MRMSADGRADRQVDHASRTDPYSVTVSKPEADRNVGQMTHGAPIPLKADIALKARPGDDREAGASKTAHVESTTTSPRVDNSFGRAKPAPPISLKTEITMKMQKGDNREGGDSRKASASRSADSSRNSRQANDKKDGLKTPLSREDKLALCKQTGVCIPMLTASDNSDDKTM